MAHLRHAYFTREENRRVQRYGGYGRATGTNVCVSFLQLRFWSIFCDIKPFSRFLFLQGNQEPAATPDAMVQPFTTIPFPPPPQNGIPTEYGVPHTQDYAGQTSEHNLTLYGSTQPHGEQSTNTASTQNGSLAVSAEGCRAEEARWCSHWLGCWLLKDAANPATDLKRKELWPKHSFWHSVPRFLSFLLCIFLF